MERKLTLNYSPCQVSNHYQKTHQTIDLEICFLRWDLIEKPCKPYFLVVVTFKCRDFQTDVQFNETFQSLLHSVNIDHVSHPRANVTVEMKNCPLECLETVTMEMLHWRNTLLSSDDCAKTLSRSFHLNSPERSMNKLTLSQLYQTSIVNCLRRANAEPFPNTIGMVYRLEGSQVMSESVVFDSTGGVWSWLVNLYLCFHHEISALDLNLLQQNLCLVFFLGVASFREFTHPLPKLNRFDAFQIEINFCQICIPVVRAALGFLLNMLSYFHVFLPNDHAFSLCAVYGVYQSYAVNWNSTRPVGCLEIPDNFFYNRDDPLPKIDIFIIIIRHNLIACDKHS